MGDDPEVNLVEHRHLDALQFLEVVTQVTGDYTAQYRDDIIVADTTLGNISVTLPKSRGGKRFTVAKPSASNTLTVLFTNGEMVFGSSSFAMTTFVGSRTFKGVTEGYILL